MASRAAVLAALALAGAARAAEAPPAEGPWPAAPAVQVEGAPQVEAVPAGGPGYRRSYWIPLAEVLGVAAVLNITNRELLAQPWADSSLQSAQLNMTRWSYDSDPFETNSFMHPYNGAIYYAAARSMGLDLWTSFGYAFLGSAVWEVGGETEPASINDQIMVFIRLAGCPLRCDWCDTPYSFSGGETWKIADILDKVASHGTQYVTVTGGEPLAQKHCLVLLEALCNAGYDVSLETSGALDVAGVDPRVSRIMDIKPPASGEVDRDRWENLEVLNKNDEIKFVLADRDDYEWALAVMRRDDFPRQVPVLFSPVHGKLAARTLAEWMLQDAAPARMQVQLHKLLWGEERAR